MKQIEADVVKAAARLHDAVLNKGPRSIEADVAVGEVVAAVDKVINAKPAADAPLCVMCKGERYVTDKTRDGFITRCPTCSD